MWTTVHSALIVDDEPSIREFLSDLLTSEGYAVTTAADGIEGLRAVETCKPSIVLLDMQMPNLDGKGFARELCKRGLDIPILVVTASRCPKRLAEEIGAAGYVAKPFDLTELLDAIERIVPLSASK